MAPHPPLLPLPPTTPLPPLQHRAAPASLVASVDRVEEATTKAVRTTTARSQVGVRRATRDNTRPRTATAEASRSTAATTRSPMSLPTPAAATAVTATPTPTSRRAPTEASPTTVAAATVREGASTHSRVGSTLADLSRATAVSMAERSAGATTKEGTTAGSAPATSPTATAVRGRSTALVEVAMAGPRRSTAVGSTREGREVSGIIELRR